MARYKIANFEVDSGDPAFPVALAQAYNAPNIEEVRPRCLCRRSEPGHEQDDGIRSEEHTSELQSRRDLVCRLLLEKKKKQEYRHRRSNNKRDSIPTKRRLQ